MVMPVAHTAMAGTSNSRNRR